MHVVVTHRIRGQLELQWKKYSRFTPTAMMGIRVLAVRCCFTVQICVATNNWAHFAVLFLLNSNSFMSCTNRQDTRISTKQYSKHGCKGGARLTQIKRYCTTVVLSSLLFLNLDQA